MIRHILSDRRRDDRRSDAASLGDKRKEHRRRLERREFIRLVYPHTVAPKALNAKFSIADISQNGMRLICRDHCQECTCPLTLKSTADLKIQFHDGETIDVEVEILRCARTLNSTDKTYAGFVEHGISAERI
ncbi:MAG: PilZ domain-containing protein, partial [Phycisphaerales bacterium]